MASLISAATGDWRFYSIVRTGKNANRLIAGNAYRYLVGIPTSQDPAAEQGRISTARKVKFGSSQIKTQRAVPSSDQGRAAAQRDVGSHGTPCLVV
jgi:hypothetical protein